MSRRLSFPLFWRIFLMLWLAMAVTVVVSGLATRELINRDGLSVEHQEGLRDIGAEAVTIRQDQGRGATTRYLKDQGEALDLHLLLIAGEQVESVDGEALPRESRDRMGAGWIRQRPVIVELDEGFRLVAWPRDSDEGWLDPHLFRWLEWGLGFVIVTLACWAIARRLSRPLGHMEATAQTIAEGDTSLRVADRIANRHDEVGGLARALNAMAEQLRGSLERQKHLLRDVSHDLRTPLTRQRIAIELASNGQADEDLMASILRQNERMEVMTSQILTLYRLTEQGTDIAREPVRLVSVLNQVLRDAADYAEHRRVDCHLTAPRDCQSVTVLGDRGLMQRALDNVLQNALDHTPPGQAVAIHLAREDGKVRCDIADNGPGVPEEALGQLFEPFYRGDESRAGQGWGLGLAIARDILRAHDGEIHASRSASGGLVVSLVWPVFTGD